MLPISNILRASTRGDEPLNILCSPTHESYESILARTGHNFYAYRHDTVKDWNDKYRVLPKNYILLDKRLVDEQLPLHVDFDVILCQSKQGQYPIFQRLSNMLHVPMICSELTAPPEQWRNPEILQHFRQHMTGHKQVFLTNYSKQIWGWGDTDAKVIKHGIDIHLFSPDYRPKQKVVLSVVNDWINRDVECGFSLWKNITQGLKVKVFGETAGLSQGASSTEELVNGYREAQVFLNTSLISPIPTSLLEAMACGTACVSTSTCEIPNVIKHGVHGLLSNDPNQLRQYIDELLKNPELAQELGNNARELIKQEYSEEVFIKNWDTALKETANIPFTTFIG